ncbi:MAG: transcriptional regulator GcvA [Pseudomonadota bacterium]
MAARLPSLTALRAFEAAARHMSFAAAADELAVTPAALSFQIKSLEEALGAPLFVRRTRAVDLTDAGRALAPHVSAGFDAFRQGWDSVQRLQNNNRLVVTAGPGFTAKWLAPGLPRFAQAHPEIELRFVSTLQMLDFARDGIDLAIRFGDGPDGDFFCETLLEDYVLPVMRPEIAARLKEPRDLLGETLIHDESISFLRPAPSWQGWFDASGIEDDAPSGPSFTQADHAIDAAEEGLGVVLGRTSLVKVPLRSGALVAPFSVALKVPSKFRMVCPLGTQTRPAVAAYRAFLKAEAAAFDATFGKRVVELR